MINVSDEFRELMNSRTDFKQYAEITLADGAVWLLDETDFTVSNNTLTDAAEASGLPLGVAVGRTIQIELMNDDDRFESVAFLGAGVRLYLTFQLSEAVEKIELGTFTVIEPETYGTTVIISAADDMWKLDKDYATSLTFPQTLGAIFRDTCTQCSVLFESATFNNYDFVVDALPENVGTYREMIGYIAMIAGGNARFNRSGKLEILTYAFPEFTLLEEINYDGGTFEDWDSGDDLDGGNFTDWSSGDSADGGSFEPWDSGFSLGENIITDDDTHVLYRWVNLKPFTEDIIITGIQTTKTVTDDEGNEAETTVLYGADGYVLSIENPLMAGKEDTALSLIGDILVGARIRNFEGDYIAYPLAEFMDKAVIVDHKGNAMPTVLTDISFNFFGMTTMKNSAAPPLRLSSKYSSAAAQAIIAAKELVAKEKTQRELAIESLNKTLATSSGLYSTDEIQEDGSTISYLHDKPTLDESQTVIKVTAEAIGVSNDGGETYSYGFFTNGDAILKVLQTEGINADWINAGALTVTDSNGNVLFQADVDTGNVIVDGNAINITLNGAQTSIPGAFSLYVQKTENDQVVSMLNASANEIDISGDRIGITSENFTLSKDGTIVAQAGTIGGFTITGSTLESTGGYGITLDAGNGAISVGDLEITSQGNSFSRIGMSESYIVIREGASYGLTFYSDSKIRMYDDVYFAAGTEFSEMPTFPSYIPVSDGGTGKGSFTSNAILLGNGTDALKALSTFEGVLCCDSSGGLPYFGSPSASALGIKSGTASVTASSSAPVDVWVSLENASSKIIVATPVYYTSYVLTYKIRSPSSSGFYIRLDKVDSSFDGSEVTFNWIAVN